jgi:hypothetical protein
MITCQLAKADLTFVDAHFLSRKSISNTFLHGWAKASIGNILISTDYKHVSGYDTDNIIMLILNSNYM